LCVVVLYWFYGKFEINLIDGKFVVEFMIIFYMYIYYSIYIYDMCVVCDDFDFMMVCVFVNVCCVYVWWLVMWWWWKFV